MFQNLWQQYLDVFFLLEWLQQQSFCLLHMECVNHIWNILKKNALKQSMVYLEWYEKKKISMNQFLSEEQLLGALYTGSDSDNYCRIYGRVRLLLWSFRRITAIHTCNRSESVGSCWDGKKQLRYPSSVFAGNDI